MSAQIQAVPDVEPLKLDIGCGKNKQAGFKGIDALAFEGVDYNFDVRVTPWPFGDETVDEIHTSHFVEHLSREEWVPFFNEAWRVLKDGAQMRVITPHWSHACAYGDPTHKSFLSEWMANYLHKGWREANAPHTDYTCNFDFVVGGSWDEKLINKALEPRMFAMQNYINSMRDLIITLTKRK